MSDRRPWLALVSVVPLRMILDASWGLPTVAGVSVAALVTGGIALALAVAAAARWRAVVSHPLRWPFLALGVAVSIGMVRADGAVAGLSNALHLLAPVVWALALHAWWDGRPAPRLWLAAGAVPVVVSLGALVAGQPQHHVVNDWPRLLGFYSDMHPHAVVMAVLVAGAGAQAVAGRDRPALRAAWAALAVGALVCLLATWVRTPLLMATVAGVAWLAARGRWRAVGGAVASGVAAIVAVPQLRDRFSDVLAVLSGSAPEGGWAAIGSWRGRIWADTTHAWLQGPPLDWIIGRGLGDHVGLHRHLEPHSEWLTLAVQLGVVGFVVWHAMMGGAMVALWRRRTDPDAALAFAWLTAAVVTAPLSNDWIARTTVVWMAWGFAAIALQRPATMSTSSSGERVSSDRAPGSRPRAGEGEPVEIPGRAAG